MKEAQDASRVFQNAECLLTGEQVNELLDQLACRLRADFADLNPVVLCVMTGGIVTLGQLLPRLDFLLQVDYVHATRYQNELAGRELSWLHTPKTDLTGRHILLVDDILDEGVTLLQLRDYCETQGAESVKALVLIEKDLKKNKPIVADYVGHIVPNRYVFGFGMDYKSYGRNLPGIYAVSEEEIR